MKQKIFIIACEPSGDTHGAHLVEAYRAQNPEVTFQGLGGPKMAEAGVDLLEDMTKISALGWGDVLRQYLTFRKIFYHALDQVQQNKPDALILIDSPAFNLRFAKKIKRVIPTLYYISPQLWAWGKQRIKVVQKYISKMLVILPFEVDMYNEAKVPCEFVGHPILDKIDGIQDKATLRSQMGIQPNEKAIGLLAGSRESEVRRILPLMLRSAAQLQARVPEVKFYARASENISPEVYAEIYAKFPEVKVHELSHPIYNVMSALDFALITSGTATLEAALLGLPYFLLYKASWGTYFLGKQLIKVPYLGIVNLLAQKRVIPEFIQRDIHPETIAHEAEVLLKNQELYEGMKRDFVAVKDSLGEKGASERAAEAVFNFLAPHQSVATEIPAPQ